MTVITVYLVHILTTVNNFSSSLHQ